MKKLNLFIYQCFRKSQRNPKKVLLLTAILVLLFGASLSKMRFLLSTDDLIGEGIPSTDRQIELKKNYPEGPMSLLVLTPFPERGNFTAEELCRIRRWLSEERLENDDLIDVQSPYDLRRSSDPSNLKYLNYPLLFSLDCDQVSKEQEVLSEKWQFVRKSPWGFLFTDKDGRDFSIQFTFRETPHFRFGSFDPKAVQVLRDHFDQKVLPSLKSVQHFWVGTADYQHATQIGLQYASRLNLFMLLFLLVAIRLAYGTWRAGLVFNFTLIFAAILVYGAKGLFNSPFDVMSNSIFLMLGISTLQDFIFLLGDQLEYGSSWRKSVRKLLLPSFYTSLTTIIGFLSLCASRLGVIDRLGFWSAVAAFVEWLLLFFVLPCVFEILGVKKTWVNSEKAYLAHLVRTWSQKRISPRFAWGAMAVYPIALIAAFHLNVNDSSQLLFQKTHQLRAGLEHLLETRHWIGSVNLVFSKELENSKKAVFFKQFSGTSLYRTHVTEVESANLQLQYLTQGQGPERGTLIRNDYETSKIGERLVTSSGEERMLLYLNQIDVNTLMGLQTELRNICSETDCNLVGSLMSYAEFSSLITKTLLESMLLSLTLVTLVICAIAYDLKKFSQIVPLLLSSFWGPMLMLGVEGIFHIRINFLTCIFASVLVGLTGDNAIQYLFGSRRKKLEYGVLKRGGASILTSLMMFSASFVFLGSYFEPQKKFGVLLAGGLLASLIGDLWILKGLKKET